MSTRLIHWLRRELYAYAMGHYPRREPKGGAMATTPTTHELDLRATLAMRAEDHRIATKHMREAAARTMSAENRAAYERALRWALRCGERERDARAALLSLTIGGAR